MPLPVGATTSGSYSSLQRYNPVEQMQGLSKSPKVLTCVNRLSDPGSPPKMSGIASNERGAGLLRRSETSVSTIDLAAVTI